MNEAVSLLGRKLHCIAPLIQISIPRAALSTNSAIHRGLRRSTANRSRLQQPPHRDGPPSRRLSRGDVDDRPRIPRPNHQHKQDFEDIRESARTKETARSPKQTNYLEGGRRTYSGPKQSKYPGSSFHDQREAERSSRGSLRATDRYARNKPHSFATPASDKPNRAARRAALYGPGDTPPQRARGFGSDPSSPRRSEPYEGVDRDDAPRYSSRKDDEAPQRPLTPGINYGRYDERPERTSRTSFHSRNPGSNNSGMAGEERRFNARVNRDDERAAMAYDVPVTIPYTTPASEFLYGTSVVSAALKFSRRKFYKLYSYSAPDRVNVSQDTAIRNLASSKGVEVMQVQGEWLRVMDKMSTGRPHNGYILEASPLPMVPITGLQSVEQPLEGFCITLHHQSREEEAINGTDGKMEYAPGFARYPFVLMLDGIVDPGNLGALLRTAYFFGVDAVAISTRNCAPFSPVTLKASAGASESLKLLSVSHPENFVDESQKNGWHFHAAVAPNESTKVNKRRPYYSTSSLECPSIEHPTVLMLGGEGEGLRANLRKRADSVIGVEGQRLGKGGVDSLNVSVAAGILCEAFMREPLSRSSVASKGATRSRVDDGNSLF